MLRVLRKILITILAATAAGLWLTVAALWVRSYWRGDVIVVHQSDANQPPEIRYHARTRVVLSGGGGIAVAQRTLSQEPLRWPYRHIVQDGKSWVSHPDPSYPKPHSTLGLTGIVRLRTVLRAGPPTTAHVTLNIPSASGVNTITADGGSLSVSTSGAVPPNVTLGGLVAPSGTITVKTGGTLVLTNPPGPTTMGSALANNAIAPPTTPPANPGQFYAYSSGTPIDPYTDIGDISRVVIFPWWAVQLVVSLPMLWAVLLTRNLIRRRARARAGCCIRCGYDLRATPERCPECGLEPAVKVTGLEVE